MNCSKTSDKKLDSKCHVGFEALLPLREEWDNFVQSVGGDIYLSFDWCAIWWECYGTGRQLRVFEYRKNGQLVGLLPMFVETVWLGPCWLKIAKVVGADFTIAMVNLPIRDDHARAAINRTICELIETDKCEAIHFGPLGGNYPSLQWILDSIQESEQVQVLRSHASTPYSLFVLPSSFENYLASLDKRQRGNLRRDLNLINREFDFTTEVLTDEGSIEHEFERFAAMHNAQWQSDGKQGHFNDWPGALEFNKRIVTTLCRRDRLRFLLMRANNEVIAYELCYVLGGRWFWRLPARLVGPKWDRFALGRIGLAKVLQSAIGEGAREVEGGAGHYEYKVKLGATEYPLHSVLLVRNSPFVKLRARLLLQISSLLHFLYYRVWFLRVAPKLPLRRRPLWKTWIRTRI